jgi:hypothetical protein
MEVELESDRNAAALKLGHQAPLDPRAYEQQEITRLDL